jgi:hypothetical protein
LVPLTYGFSVRYAVPTGLLEQLSEVCEPVVGLGWDDSELAEQLRSTGLEVVRLPDADVTHAYRNHCRKLDRVHARRLHSPTTRIRRQRWKRRGLRKNRFIEEARTARDVLETSLPGAAARLDRRTRAILADETNLGAFRDTIASTACDAVLSFTPYHDQDALLLIGARDLGVTTLVSVISFDNPTIRGRLPIDPHRVMVWNAGMADQIVRSHPGVAASTVTVVGAPQFDLHRQARLVQDEAAWRASLALPPDRPIILYGAGPSRLVPGEPALVDLLDRAIEAGRLPAHPFVLVRRHPTDPPDSWTTESSGWRHATVVAPWAASEVPMRSWPTEADLQAQMSSLAHSDVHVNVCSSMTVDGAMFDRPQIGPTFVPGAPRLRQTFVRRFYDQEHWAPIASSGGLVLAGDEEELVRAVSDALEQPAAGATQRDALLRGVLTWPDGRSTARLVDAVRAQLNEAASATRGTAAPERP